MENPFKLTQEEQAMLQKDWKKKKSKKWNKLKNIKKSTTAIHQRHTISSKQKKKVSDDLYNFL